jgi:hypothetical protein
MKVTIVLLTALVGCMVVCGYLLTTWLLEGIGALP